MTPEWLEVLQLAEALGWPVGVTFHRTDDEPPLVVSGDQRWWRAYAAECRATGGGDDTTSFWFTLRWALIVVGHGGDPGPPASWEEQAISSEEAQEGMDIETEC